MTKKRQRLKRQRLILNWGFILGVVVLVKFYYAAPGRRTLGSLIVLGSAAVLVLIWLTVDAIRAVRRGRSRAHEQTGQSGRAHTEPNAANGWVLSGEKAKAALLTHLAEEELERRRFEAAKRWHPGGRSRMVSNQTSNQHSSQKSLSATVVPVPLNLHPSRVGVAPMTVPDTIPRLKGLPLAQAKAHENFAREYESDPDRLARDYLALVGGSKDPKVFSTDDAKALSSDYNPPGAPEQDALAAGCTMNLAVHNTANAVAKRAFLMRLDEIAADRHAKKRVVVTEGGVGAGKTYAIENNSDARQLMMDADAVWDSAGEQNSTEIPWVIQEARVRGIAVDVIYVLQTPDVSWARAIRRAVSSGRVVDVRLHAESYAEGARNFDAIQKQFAQDRDVTFTILDVRSVADLSQNREDEVERQKFEWRRRIAKRRRVDKGSE